MTDATFVHDVISSTIQPQEWKEKLQPICNVLMLKQWSGDSVLPGDGVKETRLLSPDFLFCFYFCSSDYSRLQKG